MPDGISKPFEDVMTEFSKDTGLWSDITKYIPNYTSVVANAAQGKVQASATMGNIAPEYDKYLSMQKQSKDNTFLYYLSNIVKPWDYAENKRFEEAGRDIPEEIKARYDAALTLMNRAEWQYEFTLALPYILSSSQYDVSTVEEALAIMPLDSLTDIDKQYASTLFNQLAPLMERRKLPDFSSPEEVINALSVPEKKGRIVGVHQLTLEELGKALAPTQPELPAGTTTEDMYALLKKFGYSEAEANQLASIDAIAEGLVTQWIEVSAQAELMKRGVLEAQAPDLNGSQWINLIVTQPAMAAAEALDGYFNAVPRPIAGWAAANMPTELFGGITGATGGAAAGALIGSVVPGLGTAIGAGIGALLGGIFGGVTAPEWGKDWVQDVKDTVADYKEKGVDSWRAYAKAFNEAEGINWALTMYLETVADPTSYLGFGIVTKASSKVPFVGKYLSTMSGAIESGWIKMTEAPFKGARNLLAKVPKTPAAQALARARGTIGDARALIGRQVEGGFRKATADDAIEILSKSVDEAFKNPIAAADFYNLRLGMTAMEHPFRGTNEVSRWLRGLKTAGRELTDGDMMGVNEIWKRFFHGEITPTEASAELLGLLGVKNTTRNTRLMAKMLGEDLNGIREIAKAALSGHNATAVIDNLAERVQKLTTEKLESNMWQIAEGAGKITAWSRATSRFVRNGLTQWVDKHITSPMANHYLLFMNYGAMNIVENAMRSFLGGGEVLYAKGINPIDDYVILTNGLKNQHYELAAYVPRLESAIVTPDSGKTVVYKGVIPYLTKSGKMGFTKQVGNRSYKIHSLQDLMVGLPSEIGTRQRATYEISKFFQKLWEDVPDTMQQFKDIVTSRAAEHIPSGHLPSLGNKQFTADIIKRAERMATQGADNVRELAVSLPQLEINNATHKINEIMDTMTNLYETDKQFIRQELQSGRMYKQGKESVDNIMDRVMHSARERDMSMIQEQAKMLENFAKELVKTDPNDLEHLMIQAAEVSDVSWGISDRISDLRVTAQKRAARLDPVDKDKFYSGHWKEMEILIDTIEDSFGKMNKKLRTRMKKFELTPEQEQQLGELITVIDNRSKAVAKVREAQRARYTSKPKSFKGEADAAKWWNESNELIGKAWDDYWNVYYPSLTTEAALRERLTKSLGEPIHAPSFTVKGNLTPAHVATLWGGTGDDLVRSLFQGDSASLTLLGRRKFVEQSYAKAASMARRMGKSLPADIGITKEGLGDVYDQLLSRIGFDPKNVEPLTPMLKQLEAVRSELHNIHMTKKIPQSEYEQLTGFLNSVADDVEKLGVYADDTARTAWFETKDKALLEAREQFFIDFPDYDNLSVAGSFMRTIFPFWCVPEYATILTKSGWKHYSEVSIGEEVLAANPDTLVTNWEKVEKIAVFDYDDDLMVIPAKGKDVEFTPNHRWVTITKNNTQPKIKRGYELTEGYDLIPRALPHNFPVVSVLEPRLAAILGWVVTDGYYCTHKDRKTGMRIYQSDKKYVAEIESLTGTTAYPRSQSDSHNMVIGVAQSDVDKILAICPTKDNIIDIVPCLSQEAACAMWQAMLLAEGNCETQYNGSISMRFIQNSGVVMQAFQLLSVLLGKAITISDTRVNMLYNKQPYKSKQVKRMHTKHYKGKVWCPVTPSGTWIMNCNGSVVVTGNTYEWQRYFWIPRAMSRNPVVATSVGRYLNYSDNGYIPIPYTDLQINPLRGTVLAGGFRRAYMRDFPEYHDAFPGMEAIDYISRYGFYPGAQVMFPIIAFGAAKGRPELGEVAPAWLKTGLDAVIAVSPDSAAKTISQHLFPDRFRDYVTIVTMVADGLDGMDVWDKMQSGKATEEDNKLWGKYTKKVSGLQGILMEQTGMFRIRPEEYNDFIEATKKLIEERLGVPVAIQDKINKLYPVTGKRISDYYKLDPLDQKILYEVEQMQLWSGVISPLMPSEWQEVDRRIREYWDATKSIQEKARVTGFYDADGNVEILSEIEANRLLVHGNMSPEQWENELGDALNRAAIEIQSLKDNDYTEVPVTLEERAAYYAERGEPMPTEHPGEEMIRLWYEQSPKKRWDFENERWVTDFATYYAATEKLLDLLPEPYKQRFLDTIMYRWSPLTKLHWTVNKDYIRPYRLAKDVILQTLTPEEKDIIARYEVAAGSEREALKEFVHAETGQQLISWFTSKLGEVHTNMRKLDPELDAWLMFWGEVDTAKTSTADKRYQELREQYLTEDMIGG
jgi:hypothetical protein